MQKFKQSIPLAVSLFFIIFDFFSLWCIYDLGICRGTFFHNVVLDFTQPIYIYSLATIPVFIILIFVKETIFKVWLRFALPWLVFFALGIALTPQYGSLFQSDRLDASWYLGGLFVFISFLIILFGYAWPPLARRFSVLRKLSLPGFIAGLTVAVSLVFGLFISTVCSGECYPWSTAYSVPIVFYLGVASFGLDRFGAISIYGGIILLSFIAYILVAKLSNLFR